jgi:hypothetical protein
MFWHDRFTVATFVLLSHPIFTLFTASYHPDLELSKKKNRLSSGCDSMVVAEHSAEALSALNRMMG